MQYALKDAILGQLHGEENSYAKEIGSPNGSCATASDLPKINFIWACIHARFCFKRVAELRMSNSRRLRS